MSNKEPAEGTQKLAEVRTRRTIHGGFGQHTTHHPPEGMGLQAVWANIWGAVLAGYIGTGCGRRVGLGYSLVPLFWGWPVPEVLLSRLRCKPDIIPVGRA
jgi:hypothetical protein